MEHEHSATSDYVLERYLESVFMTISAEQLAAWAKPPGGVKLEELRAKIEKILVELGAEKGLKFEVYLQGSYANGTYLDSGSDVDFVVERAYPSLSDIPQATLQAQQEWESLCGIIESKLKSELKGTKAGTNAIKVPLSDGTSADIVVGMKFVKQLSTPGNIVPAGTSGITFIRRNNAYNKQWTINFPKLHLQNSNRKETRTSGKYKRIVRVFKHLKAHCKPPEGMKFSSYLIECLVFSAPDACFVDDVSRSVRNVLGHIDLIRETSRPKCPNGITELIGTAVDQFSLAEIQNLASQIASLL